MIVIRVVIRRWSRGIEKCPTGSHSAAKVCLDRICKGQLTCYQLPNYPVSGCSTITLTIAGSSLHQHHPVHARIVPAARAAGGNHVEIMNYLLEKGALVDQADKSGRTALHWAVISGHKEATDILLGKVSHMYYYTEYYFRPTYLRHPFFRENLDCTFQFAFRFRLGRETINCSERPPRRKYFIERVRELRII